MISIIVRIVLGSLIGAILANQISEMALDDRFIDVDLSDGRRQSLAVASLYPSVSVDELQTLAEGFYWYVAFEQELPECFYPIDLSKFDLAGEERQNDTSLSVVPPQFANSLFYENDWPLFERPGCFPVWDEEWGEEWGEAQDKDKKWEDEEMALDGDIKFSEGMNFDDRMSYGDDMGYDKDMSLQGDMDLDDMTDFDGKTDLDDRMSFDGETGLENDPFEYRQAISVPGGYLVLGPQNERLYNSRSGQVLDELDFYSTSLMFVCMLLVNALLLMGWTRGVGRLQKLTAAFATGDLAFRIQERGPEPLRVLISNMHQMAKQLDQAEKQQQVMMNALPHELRTPLARIRMACDMLQVQPEQQEKWLGRAQQYLDDMEHLVQALLRLNRIASQQLKPDAEPVDLAELTSHLVEQESQHDPRIHCHFVDDTIKTLPVIGDRELISVVISNLIMNACRYSQTEVLVRVERMTDKVLVSISDDGKGFPEEQIAHLLQPFNRGDENRSRTSGGFGLGLAIVDVIIRAHHGRVQLSNLPEGGACVQFELPLVD